MGETFFFVQKMMLCIEGMNEMIIFGTKSREKTEKKCKGVHMYSLTGVDNEIAGTSKVTDMM